MVEPQSGSVKSGSIAKLNISITQEKDGAEGNDRAVRNGKSSKNLVLASSPKSNVPQRLQTSAKLTKKRRLFDSATGQKEVSLTYISWHT